MEAYFNIFCNDPTTKENRMERKIKILIADDDKEVTRIIAQSLPQDLYEADVALDGEQALSKLIEKKFDVAIIDLKMPIISGHGILKYIKLNTPSTKVIVLTAYADLKNIEECKRLGAEHVLGKPFDLEMLFWTINLVTGTSA
jgi:CheY-like chemotaxis protein